MGTAAIIGLIATVVYNVLPMVLKFVNRDQTPAGPTPPAPSPVTPVPTPLPVIRRPVIDLIHAILAPMDNPWAQITDKELQLLRLALDLAQVPPLFQTSVTAGMVSAPIPAK